MNSTSHPNPSRRDQALLSWLLIALLFTIAVVPIVEYFRDARELVHIGLSAVLLIAVALLRGKRVHLLATGLIAIAAVALSWTTLWVPSPTLFLASAVLDALFLVMIAVFILLTVLRQHMATVESIFGAIAAYLLIGLAFALVYWGIAYANPEALKFPELIQGYQPQPDEVSLIREYSYFIYFSFVTMSTLGFGDITPQTTISQTLTWLQAVIGQFYIAVLVAWLVSEISSARQKDT